MVVGSLAWCFGLPVGRRTGRGRRRCARRLGGATPRARRVADRQRRGSSSPRPDADHPRRRLLGAHRRRRARAARARRLASPHPEETGGPGSIPGSPPSARCRSSSLPVGPLIPEGTADWTGELLLGHARRRTPDDVLRRPGRAARSARPMRGLRAPARAPLRARAGRRRRRRRRMAARHGGDGADGQPDRTGLRQPRRRGPAAPRCDDRRASPWSASSRSWPSVWRCSMAIADESARVRHAGACHTATRPSNQGGRRWASWTRSKAS